VGIVFAILSSFRTANKKEKLENLGAKVNN